MRRAAVILLLPCASLLAQVTMDERRLGPARAALEDEKAAQTLHCSVSPIHPQLNYSFRFQAGYVVTIPMNQFEGAGHRWWMVTRITPDEGDGRPVYLMSGFALPAIPPTKVELQVGGGYLLGEGGYRVRHLFLDEAGRTCRHDWHVEVHRGRGEGKVRVAMPPGSVLDVSLRGRRARSAVTPDDARPIRLTILLHTAPMFPRRTRLRTGDILTLLASVTSVLERVPAVNVRLVAFNLDQQRELYRKDGFGLSDLPAVANAMTRVELGLVDAKVLQNRRGTVETLAGLVNAELAAEPSPDTVVFLGPPSRFSDKPSPEVLDRAAAGPQFLFFQLAPPIRLGRGGRGLLDPSMPMAEPTLADSIRHAVSRLGGKTITIHTPGDLAKAIDRLEQSTALRRTGLEADTKKAAPPAGGTARGGR